MSADEPSGDSMLASAFARLDQIGKRFAELVAIKRAELLAAEPTLDAATLNERAAIAAGEQLAKERGDAQ